MDFLEDRVGEIAGEVWSCVESEGECSLTQVTDSIDEPRSKVFMAIGWLAREGKLDFNDEGRGTSISLR